MGCALAFPLFLKYWNWILCTHNLALNKVKSDRMLPNFTFVIAIYNGTVIVYDERHVTEIRPISEVARS